MDKLINKKKLSIIFKNRWHALFNRFGFNETNKKNGYDALPENWASCYAVFSSLGDAVVLNKVIYNKKGKAVDYVILDVNHPAFEQLTALDRNESVGKKASRIYNLGSPPFLKQISECLDKGKPVIFETYFSPIEKHVSVSIHRLNHSQFVTVLTDISERKIKEIELSSSQRLLDSIICQSPDVIYRLDKEGRITFISNAINNYGYKPQDLIGKSIMEIVHPDDREKAQYKVNERRTGDRSTKTLEIRLLSLKNDPIPFETVLVDIEKTPCFSVNAEGQYYNTNPDGTKFVGTQGIMRDVTHRKMALNLLKTTNDELEKKVKYRTEQLEKALDKLVFENATRKKTEEDLRKARIELEKKVNARSEELIEVNKKLDEEAKERQELHSQLLQIQKMDAVGTLAGGIAHDFNNMLTVINGHAEVGLSTLANDEPGHRHLLSILKAGKRAENLTRQLLAFSRKQIFDTQILNINKLIDDLDKMMRRLIGEDILIESNLNKNIPTIKGELGQIEQVLVNLIVNARDAINDHTKIASAKKISIETDVKYMDKSSISKHIGLCIGKYVVIAVSDNGIGMSKEVQEKIFEPFFTTKTVGQGTGLGLATVYGIVKQNDAFIYVYSELGKGTTFKIYWPVSEAEKDQKEFRENEKIVMSGNEIVLLVEDDESVRSFASSALKELGYNVFEASNGKKALQLLHDKNIKPNLLITDMIMPEINGKELVAKLSVLLPQMKVIYTSGYTDNFIIDQGEFVEGIHFIQKPFSLRSFAEKIREVLETDDLLV